MAFGDYISAGTISVAAGGTVITGAGTSWTSGGMPVISGDTMHAGGVSVPIAAVNGAGEAVPRLPWPGATLSGAPYAICLDSPARLAATKAMTDVADLVARLRLLERNLYQPKVKTVGGNAPPATPAENDIHVAGTAPTGAWAGYPNNYMTWTGSGWLPQAPQIGDAALVSGTADLSIWNGSAWVTRPYTGGAVRYDASQSLTGPQKAQARGNIEAQQALGFTPVQQGGGIDQTGAKIYIGLDLVRGPVMTVNTTDFGRIWNDAATALSLGVSSIYKFPNGYTIQFGYVGSFSGNHTTTFPIAFSSVSRVHGIQPYLGGLAANQMLSYTCGGSTTTNFQVSPRLLSGGTVSVASAPYVYCASGW